MTESNDSTFTESAELDSKRPSELFICSGGRGGILADRIRSIHEQPFSDVHLIDPQISINTDDVELLFDKAKATDILMREQVAKWLLRPTEGRPIVGSEDYIYGLSGLPNFCTDLTRIATLKFRSLFPTLMNAYRNGLKNINAIFWARDTGQLIKAPNSDLFVYQSHPGNNMSAQYRQFAELFYSRYALVCTATAMIKGTVPTEHIQNIMDFFTILYASAHKLQVQKNYIPDKLSISIAQPCFITAFQITPDAYTIDDIVLPEGTLTNIPGGVNWDDFRIKELVEYWKFSDDQIFAVRSSESSFEHFDLIGKSERWQPLYPIRSSSNTDYEDFTSIRRGMPPRSYLKSMFALN